MRSTSASEIKLVERGSVPQSARERKPLIIRLGKRPRPRATNTAAGHSGRLFRGRPGSSILVTGAEAFRGARRFVGGASVAARAWCGGAAAGARVRAFPGLIGMVLADPAAVLAHKALHR
jgi:hypothetical protein